MAIFVADEQEREVDVDGLLALARHALADRRVPDAMELNVLCIDRASMTELNVHHMEGTGPTDVLAFPLDMPGESLAGEPLILGDVVLCPDVAAEQAPEHGATYEAELELLLVHGILHLLGHDHADDGERREMFALTDRILASFRSAGR